MSTCKRTLFTAAALAVLALVAEACGPRVTCLRYTDCDDGYTCGAGFCVPNTPVADDTGTVVSDASTVDAAHPAADAAAHDASTDAADAHKAEASTEAGTDASGDASLD